MTISRRSRRARTGLPGSAIDIGVPSPMAHTDLARLREGGVGGVFFAAYVAASYGLGPRAYERGQK